jgi:hypothetical protein
LISIVVAGLVFVLVPYSPNSVLELLAGTRVGSALMLLGVLAVVQIDVVISLAVALAVAAIFIEYRKRVVMKIQNNLVVPNTPDRVSNIGSKRTLIPSEKHPAAETATVEEVGEERAAPTTEREPLETIDAHSEAIAKLMEENGFASLS